MLLYDCQFSNSVVFIDRSIKKFKIEYTMNLVAVVSPNAYMVIWQTEYRVLVIYLKRVESNRYGKA